MWISNKESKYTKSIHPSLFLLIRIGLWVWLKGHPLFLLYVWHKFSWGSLSVHNTCECLQHSLGEIRVTPWTGCQWDWVFLRSRKWLNSFVLCEVTCLQWKISPQTTRKHSWAESQRNLYIVKMKQFKRHQQAGCSPNGIPGQPGCFNLIAWTLRISENLCIK